MRTDTLGGLLERASRRRDVGLRLLDRSEQARFFPWSEVWSRALDASSRLQRAGVRPGDRVALIYPTSIEFIDALFGCVLAGAVPVPLYPPVRLHRLDEYSARTAAMLDAVSAELVLVDRRIRPILGAAVTAAGPRSGCRTLAELANGPGAAVPRTADDLALIQFSSGTTVAPKPAALSHGAVVAQAVALNGHWPDSDACVHSGVSWLPLYHDMGLIGCVVTALERPGTMTLIPPELFLARPAVWLRAISTTSATISVAPNFAYGLCVEKIGDDDLEGVDLSSWRVALCGAEPVVPRVLRRFIRRFAPYGLRPEAVTPVYGLSEATLAVTFSAIETPFVSRRFDRDALSRDGRAVEAADGLELVSVGRPVGDAAVRIVDAGGAELPDGLIGEILTSGSSLMAGYYGRPEATGEVLRDGWLHTGDLGFVHDGELFLTGRAKDLLIIRGRNHPPTEVEVAVDGVPGVRTGCSVAVSWLPDGADGEVLLLLAEIERRGRASGSGDIGDACRAAVRTATGLELDRVELLEPGTLPRTSSGKLRRQESLRLYLAGELLPPGKVKPWKLAGAAVRGALDVARLNRDRRDG